MPFSLDLAPWYLYCVLSGWLFAGMIVKQYGWKPWVIGLGLALLCYNLSFSYILSHLPASCKY